MGRSVGEAGMRALEEQGPKPCVFIAELEADELNAQAAFMRGRVARMPDSLSRLRSQTAKTADRLALLARLRAPGQQGPLR